MSDDETLAFVAPVPAGSATLATVRAETNGTRGRRPGRVDRGSPA